jgi:hypothetical protein
VSINKLAKQDHEIHEMLKTKSHEMSNAVPISYCSDRLSVFSGSYFQQSLDDGRRYLAG